VATAGGDERAGGAQRSSERLLAVADSALAFGQATRDYPAILDVVAERVCAALGELALVCVVDPDGKVSASAVAGRQATAVAELREAFAANLDTREFGVVSAVLRADAPLLAATVDPGQVVAQLGARGAEIMARVGVRGFVSVPLRAQGGGPGSPRRFPV